MNSHPRLFAAALLGLALVPLGTGGVASRAMAADAVASQPRPMPDPAPHERLLPLEGGRNFRDLGGYETADGHHVKWGLLFRSGSMHGLTPADYGYLSGRGIKVVCDLRDSAERSAEPVAWPKDHAPRVLADDYRLDMAGMMPKGPPSEWTADKARAMMIESYPRMLDQFSGQYRRMFLELLWGHAPLAFNCSAGKDRTGIAAALLLTALGVPRATVIEDYTATNRYLDAAKMMKASAGSPPNPATAGLNAMPEGVVRAMMAADPAYIEAALAVLDAHEGGAEGYLRDTFQLDHEALARLRALYLD